MDRDDAAVDRASIDAHIQAMPGVMPKDAWGETSYFYNPGGLFERGTYFATIKDRDGANDRASRLNRPCVWRLNMGVSKGAYLERFGPPPPRPGKGGVVEGPWDFTARDTLTPHPVYGWMSWVAVLCPSPATWAACLPLLNDAHARARAGFDKRARAARR